MQHSRQLPGQIAQQRRRLVRSARLAVLTIVLGAVFAGAFGYSAASAGGLVGDAVDAASATLSGGGSGGSGGGGLDGVVQPVGAAAGAVARTVAPSAGPAPVLDTVTGAAANLGGGGATASNEAADEAVPPGATNGDPGNILDGVTDLVQNLAPGASGEKSGIDLAPINLEVPGVVDVAADVDLLTPGRGLLGLVAVPCLGIGLLGESADCPNPVPEECEGRWLNIPLDPEISGLLDGAIRLSADDCGIHLCLNLGLLGVLMPDCPEPTGTPPTSTPVTGSTTPGPVGPSGGPTGGGPGGPTLPFTGADAYGLAGLGGALLAGGHLFRRLTTRSR
jgi:hypothetical protein